MIRISSHHSSPSTTSLHWHIYSKSCHLTLLLFEDTLSFIEFFDIRLFLLWSHAIVSLCSQSNNIRCSHMRILLFDLDALASYEHIVWISRRFLHEWNFIIIFLFRFYRHLPRIFLSNCCGSSGRAWYTRV